MTTAKRYDPTPDWPYPRAIDYLPPFDRMQAIIDQASLLDIASLRWLIARLIQEELRSAWK